MTNLEKAEFYASRKVKQLCNKLGGDNVHFGIRHDYFVELKYRMLAKLNGRPWQPSLHADFEICGLQDRKSRFKHNIADRLLGRG